MPITTLTTIPHGYRRFSGHYRHHYQQSFDQATVTVSKIRSGHRLGQEALSDVLEKATKARSRGIQLAGMKFASELSTQMLQFAGTMEKLYSRLKVAISSDPVDDDLVKRLLTEFETESKNHEAAEVRLRQKSRAPPTPMYAI